MAEFSPILINIDDEYSFKRDTGKVEVPHLDAHDVNSLIKQLKENPEILEAILKSEAKVVISLDEHLPWGSQSGADVYEGLGKFLLLHAAHPENIFFIGISSNPRAQEYMPAPNKSNKSFFGYAAMPELLIGQRYQPLSIADIFAPSSYKTPKTEFAYSYRGDEIFKRLKKELL
ncbi:MAG TPA: hypothetical protein VF209_04735 [Patescibacteria group bacterium]